jgi:hypothetical protein
MKGRSRRVLLLRDYQQYKKLPKRASLPAQYRQTYPCKPGENYTFMEAKGRGHYAGVNLSIHLNADGWWGEGDDMIYVDGAEKPQFNGTGSEDYFCGAWCYGLAFSDLHFACHARVRQERPVERVPVSSRGFPSEVHHVTIEQPRRPGGRFLIRCLLVPDRTAVPFVFTARADHSDEQ